MRRTFVVSAGVRSARDFDVFAAAAARLRRHGRVEMNVANLSGRDFSEVPAGGSPWHEYAAYGVGLHKFYPHPKLAQFVDAEFVARNRRLLRSCVKVLRAHKLGACFQLHEPHFLPEAFFQAHPHLRGPRVDHPRRSRAEAYAMCLDHPEGREILSAMAADLARDVPDLGTMHVLTNDAGSGFCWCEYLYPGPNGPAGCRGVGVGERVAAFVAALRDGTGKGNLDVVIAGNFTAAENHAVRPHLDDHVFWSRQPERTIRIGTVADNPVRGVIDPVGILAALQGWRRPEIRKVFLGFGTNYRRGHELPEAASMVIDIVDAFCRRPAYGLLNRLEFLRGLCARWAGEGYADELLEAFVALREALTLKQQTLGKMNANNAGVSMRMINRPLVAMPEKLAPDEEDYFLPYVFNVRPDQARSDYLDRHGSRPPLGIMGDPGPNPSIGNVDRCRGMFERVADALAAVPGRGRPAGVLRRMALSLRIHSCIMRSVNNFHVVQTVRDHCAEKLTGQPVAPPKRRSMTGDPDLLLLHERMRDELDNTARLVDILAAGGLGQLALAPTADLEDTFLLGPDLPSQLTRKMAIMRRHWLDASRHLAPPMK